MMTIVASSRSHPLVSRLLSRPCLRLCPLRSAATVHGRLALPSCRPRPHLTAAMSALDPISRPVTQSFTSAAVHSASHRQPLTAAAAPTATAAPAAAYQWAVIGAGPAGLACVGQLLDRSVPAASILWLDPSFAVGDFGTKWRNVSSNTTVGLFRRFYGHCRSFQYDGRDGQGRSYAIEGRGDKETCLLDVAAEPLRDVTARLRRQVTAVAGEVVRLEQHQQHYRILLSSPPPPSTTSPAPSTPSPLPPATPLLAANVILATGSQARQSPALHSPHPHIAVLPLTTALDPAQLVHAVQPSDHVLIVGSSHTAIILIRTLLERCNVAAVYNCYREPLRYALYMDDWILFDDTGLKGDTARWAREHLHGAAQDSPTMHKLTRFYSNEHNLNRILPKITKIIYATGFDRRNLRGGIQDLSDEKNNFSYNPNCGIIAPGLFGCGIGFPEQKIDRYGNVELRVGLWKFMVYIESVLPLWMKYSVLEGIGQPKGAPGSEKPKAKL